MDLDFLYEHYSKVPQRQKQWHIDQNIDHLILCKTCGINVVNWSVKNKQYSTYCCSKCAQTDQVIQNKREATMIKKYGARTNLMTEENKKKIRETCLERYGVDNFAKSPEFLVRSQQTFIERYGVSNPSQSLVIKQQIADTHQKKYNRKRASQQHIDIDIIALKNNKEKMLELYQTQKMPISEIAELLGVNHSQLCVHFKDNLGIDISRHCVSRSERELVQFFKEVGVNVETSNRSILSPKELDIYLPDKKIAVELNGLAWHTELRGKDKDYHLNKTILCEQQGIRLIHIWDSEWINQQELVKSRLLSVIGKSIRIPARKCQIIQLSAAQSKEFFDNNHIQKNCVSHKTIGLTYQGNIVAAMSFGKPRFNKTAKWELLRYANLINHSVIGGASRLFLHFLKTTQVSGTIISYCDRRWNTGNLYSQLGFSLSRTTGPNYWYVKNYSTIEHRVGYQKHKLSQKLTEFDSELTEWENMINNRYDRVWDCGNWVFEFSK